MIEGLPVLNHVVFGDAESRPARLIQDSWPLATAKTAIYRGNLSTTAIPAPPFAPRIEATKW
jgi:hypothetical protein